jgi:hypothetical protein
MPFTGSVMPASFKQELMLAYHNFGVSPIRLTTAADTFKIALYDNSPSFNKTTTVYTTSGEVSGTGYTAGGNTLVISDTPTIDTSGSVNAAYINFANTSWSSASFTTYGALIYNSTQGDRVAAVLDFGGAKTVVSGTLTINFPVYSSGVVAAIIQLQ